MNRPRIEVAAAVLGAPQARPLADFYQRLLGWEMVANEADWIMLREPGGAPDCHSSRSPTTFLPSGRQDPANNR